MKKTQKNFYFFKHRLLLFRDPEVVDLCQESLISYAYYMIILEICVDMHFRGYAQPFKISESMLRQDLRLTKRRLREELGKVQARLNLGVTFAEPWLNLEIPNLLELVGDNPTLDKEEDKDKDKDKEIEKEFKKNILKKSSLAPHKQILDYLNATCKKKYTYRSKSTIEHINARLREGFKIDDFKKVIDVKNEEWKFDPNMKNYLRPQTLFGTKFESYLNQALEKEKPSFKEQMQKAIELEKRGLLK